MDNTKIIEMIRTHIEKLDYVQAWPFETYLPAEGVWAELEKEANQIAEAIMQVPEWSLWDIRKDETLFPEEEADEKECWKALIERLEL